MITYRLGTSETLVFCRILWWTVSKQLYGLSWFLKSGAVVCMATLYHKELWIPHKKDASSCILYKSLSILQMASAVPQHVLWMQGALQVHFSLSALTRWWYNMLFSILPSPPCLFLLISIPYSFCLCGRMVSCELCLIMWVHCYMQNVRL